MVDPILSIFEGNNFLTVMVWISLLLAFVLLVTFPPIYSLINGTIPNLYYVGKAVISIFVGVVLSKIVSVIIPIILSIFTNTEQVAIIWIFIILIWIITLIIVPVHFMSEATKT